MNNLKIRIKKYTDRRLYDTAASRYVKLDDIARMIRAGADVEVIDAGTGEDITRAILTQIVMEDARNGGAGLPMQFLRELVMASDRATHDFLSRSLNQTLEVYRKSQEAIHAGFSEARHAVTDPLGFVKNLIGGDPDPATGRDEEIALLRRRIEQLEARLAQAGAPRRKPGTRKRRTTSGRRS